MKTWIMLAACAVIGAANRWRTLAILGWAILCIVVVSLFIAKPEKVTGFAPYLRGAEQ